MANNVTSKGQVTIPKGVRDRLGLRPGDSVEFDLAENGSVVMLKAAGTAEKQEPVSRFQALIGSAGPGMTTDEVMALVRGEW